MKKHTGKDFDDFKERIFNSPPPVYFLNDFEEAAIKSLPDNKFMVKIKGSEEFLQEPVDNQINKLITDGILSGMELTEEEYNSY